MPSGNSHTKISIIASGICAVGGYYADLPVQGMSAATGLMIGDLWLSCDLDGERSNAKRRWWILKFIWCVYEKFPHRSPFTHFPIIGDAIRLAYLALVILPVVMAVGLAHDGVQGAVLDTFWAMDMVSGTVAANPVESTWGFIGLCLATLLHGMADWVVSEGKKMADGPDRPAKRKKGGRPKKGSRIPQGVRA